MSWLLDQAGRYITDDMSTLPRCEYGHAEHPTTLTPVVLNGVKGKMHTFDPMQEEGYCIGDDDVSRTLRTIGTWEPVETRMFLDVVAEAPRDQIVLDFGAHLGWYSLLAVGTGHPVLAFEAVEEHAWVWCKNLGVAADRFVVAVWIDEDTPQLQAEGAPRVACVKIDLEGKEWAAIHVIGQLLDADLVESILMEVSPVFNPGYPNLIRRIMERGFTAEVCNPHQPFSFDEIDAVVAQAPQVDMMFRRQR